jgi:predicted TPR repeat methyltransferase
MPSTEPILATLQEAVRLHQEGEFDAAEALYGRVLSAVPAQPDALHFLGVLRHQQHRSDEAIDLIREALTAAPDYVDAWNNLGNIQKENGRLEAAGAAYREALARNDAHAAAWNNLGVVLRAQGACREAVAAFHRVLELAPTVVDAYYNLANALRECGSIEEAIAAYREALRLAPGQPNLNVAFGYVLYSTGRHAEAVAVFRDWLAADPESPIAAHMLAACSGEDVPARASDEYLRSTFDNFANNFDEQLLRRLDYHAPELLVANLTEVLGEPGGDLKVLDAGCGTGLCGPLLRPYANRLAGVDLSPRMLAKAQARGSYDELHEAELTAFLVANEAEFDLIASADTLIYFGELDGVAAAAHKALKRGGWLGFTVERNDVAENYRIHAHGRYSHSERYLRSVLASAGFASVAIAPVVLRQELQQPVHGWVVRAQVA